MEHKLTVQDDDREKELIFLFELERPDSASRIGIDALLNLNGEKIPFELKSTSTGSVTTVRDFGYAHIKKWKDKHWLIGKYDKSGQNLEYVLYGSPRMMQPWILEKEAYIRPDFELGKLVPELIHEDILHKIVGKKDVYTLSDAKNLQKKQYSIEKYKKLMDTPNGYSPERMLSILKERCSYLLSRGSTLNNPHIPASYFNGWEKIEANFKSKLIELVNQELLRK